jgi:DNA-binding transcriptional MerR regulator
LTLAEDIQPTYTTAQVHLRLGVPKPTIRNWSAEYAEFLSERAQSDSGKTRLFTYDDLIILNTVRHLTRVEGLNSNDLVRAALAAGQRVTELPQPRSEEEIEALSTVQLVTADRLERVLDSLNVMEGEVERLGQEVQRVEVERDQALIALDGVNTRMTRLREVHGQIRGILFGVSMAGIALLFITVAALTALITFMVEVQP